MSSIAALPPEILLEILAYLSAEDLLDNVQNVCTTWRQLARHPSVWHDYAYDRKYVPGLEEVLAFVEKCPMLKHISVHIGCESKVFCLEDLVRAVIKKCTDVRTFCVSCGYDKLTVLQIDALFEAFPNMEFFQIVINTTNMTPIVDRISKCTKLKKLLVRNEEYCEDWVKPIVHGCLSLEYLDFYCSAFAERDFHYVLENMKDRLSFLSFSWHQMVTQHAVNVYSTFTKLRELTIYHGGKSGRVNFLPLVNIKTLKYLYFSSGSGDVEEVVTIFDTLFVSPFPLLQELHIDMQFCNWGRTVLKDVCLCYPNLKSLDLCYSLLEEVREPFKEFRRFKQLENFSFLCNRAITDDDIDYICRCSTLKHLDLHSCYGITDSAMAHVTKCKSLEYLNFIDCSVKGLTLHLIPEHLTKLKTLRLSILQCDQIQLEALRKKMPSLDVT